MTNELITKTELQARDQWSTKCSGCKNVAPMGTFYKCKGFGIMLKKGLTFESCKHFISKTATEGEKQ